jgi:hypothetical protein
MSFLSSPIFGYIQHWLLQPQTWVAVVLPATLSLIFLTRHRVTALDLWLVFFGVLTETLTSQLQSVDGVYELHVQSWFACGITLLVGLRLYLPAIGKAYALTWLVSILSDFFSMTRLEPTLEGPLQLPIGIGGAGLGDALFVTPLLLAAGLWLLQCVRQAQMTADLREPTLS